ncbi:MAG: exodeoxyribonuclease V subunit gamma [Eubacterium sp.]|nr:exodeoxyribonuclease V subunit gamma [Eubacterium sp.]
MGADISFTIGASGTGKTFDMMRRVAEAAIKSPDKKYLMIVPEQAASTIERDMVNIMSLYYGKNGFMNIDIVGISRLAYKIFDEMRIGTGGLLADADKSMVIRLVAGRTGLRVYRNSIDKDGFIKETKSILSEMFQYNISLSDIEKVINELDRTGERNVLSEKLKDIRDIFSGFERRIAEFEEGSIPAEKLVAFLLDKMGEGKCNILDDTYIFFDGFTGYTPAQYDLIAELMKRAGGLDFTVTMDSEIVRRGRMVKDYEIFHLSFETYEKLSGMAKDRGLPVKNVRLYDKNMRHKEGSMLSRLTDNIFRFPVKNYKENDDSLMLWECKDPEEQLSCIAEEIIRLVREEGMRYRDIAVFAPDLSDMSNLFDKVFTRYGIPFFPDYTRKLRQNPFTEAISLLFEIEERNYDYESVFSLVKNSVIPELDDSEIAVLENFVLAKNIKGYKRWNRSFSYTLNNEDRYVREEAARVKLMRVLKPFSDMLKGTQKITSEMIDAIKDFMDRTDYPSQIGKMADMIEREGNLPLANTYRRLYDIILSFLDEMNLVLGNEYISKKEFSGILRSGMNEVKIGTIPATVDSVIVGDTERTRVSDIRVLFLIDLNEGVVPKPHQEAKILTDYDKELIGDIFKRLEIKREFAPDDKRKLFIEQFYLYLAMAKPKERLILSYNRMSCNGEEKAVSYVIPRIKAIFSEMPTEKKTPEVFRGTESTDVFFFTEAMRRRLYDPEEEQKTIEEDALLYSLFRDKKSYIDMAAGYRKDDGRLSEEAVDASKENILKQSVTRLERYAGCEYKYYLTYMLGLQERQDHRLDQLSFGNVLHKALEKVFTSMNGDTPEETYKNWSTVTKEEEIKMMDKAVAAEFRTLSDDLVSPEGDIIAEGHNRFIVQNIYELGEKTIVSLGDQVKGGEMAPRFYEEKFYDSSAIKSSGIKWSDSIMLNGTVDRADIYEQGDNVFVRVIDYKTGNKEFNYKEFYTGRQLQLVTYLGTMVERVREYYKRQGRKVNVIPVGMYYYPVKDPYITMPADDIDEKELEAAFRRELHLRGIVAKDPFMQEIQERGITDPDRRKKGPAVILPLEFYSRAYKGKQAGDAKGEYVELSTEEFENVIGYAKVKAGELVDDMVQGFIRKNPVRCNRSSECDYCSFNDVCRFDQYNRDNRERRISKDMSDKEYDAIFIRGRVAAGNDEME